MSSDRYLRFVITVDMRGRCLYCGKLVEGGWEEMVDHQEVCEAYKRFMET